MNYQPDDWFVKELREWCAENPLGPLLPDGEKFDTGFNKGQKCDWVGEQNRTREQTPELRAKLAEGTKKQGRTIYCPDLKKEWMCAKDAEKELGIGHKMIYRVCEGHRNKTGGLRFEFRGEKRHDAINRRNK